MKKKKKKKKERHFIIKVEPTKKFKKKLEKEMEAAMVGEYAVGYYENKPYCVGRSNMEVDIYFQTHRSLDKGDYEIKTGFVRSNEFDIDIEDYRSDDTIDVRSLLEDGYGFVWHDGLLLPQREMRWIMNDMQNKFESIRTNMFFHLIELEKAFSLSGSKFKEEAEAVRVLYDFFSPSNADNSEYADKLLKTSDFICNMFSTHPLVYMNMREFKYAEARYLEEEEMDKRYRYRIESEDAMDKRYRYRIESEDAGETI